MLLRSYLVSEWLEVMVRLSMATRIYLWVNYQRYAILMLVSALLSAGAAYHLYALSWLFSLGTATASAYLVVLGMRSMGQFAKKLVLTKRASRRIEQGTFEKEQLIKYCTDPCWRLVVGEILQRSGCSRAQVKAHIRVWSKEAKAHKEHLIIVNREGNVVYTSKHGKTQQSQAIKPSNLANERPPAPPRSIVNER